jgi:hypothetical protein
MEKLSISLFKDEHTPVIALLGLVIRKYTTACFNWEPETLREAIQDDYNIVLSGLQSDKIQAGITLLSTNLFEENIKVFENVCYLLNNQADDLDTINPIGAEEMVCALAHVFCITGDDFTPFASPEVRAYAGEVFYTYGLHAPPIFFMNAIMKNCPLCDVVNEELIQALEELYNEKVEQLTKYLDENKNLFCEQQQLQ